MRAVRINGGIAVIAAAVVGIALLPSPATGTAAGTTSGQPPTAGDQVTPAHPGYGRAKDVVANLFEWSWRSVAKECTTVLGPNGYGAVQVAPPQDSVKRAALGNGSDTVLHPWWEVYQPWIAINNETAAKTVNVATGLPAGQYCDIIHGATSGHHCSGPVVTVGSRGRAMVTVPATDSVAIYALSRI